MGTDRLGPMVTMLLILSALGCTTETSWLRKGYVARIQRADSSISSDRETAYQNTVQVRWLGTAGFHISLGDEQVLLDPFFSQQSLLGSVFTKLEVRDDVTEKRIGDVSEVDGILVGHAHWDHLLDVPDVAIHHAKKAISYGSLTTFNLLRALDVPHDRVKRASREVWLTIPNTNIRFKAYRSKHSPHVDRIIHLYQGKVKTLPKEPPTWASDFKEGRTLTYVIQFMDESGENSKFTIFYADSASGGMRGLPDLDETGDIDLAILTVAAWKNVDDYVETKLKCLKPKHVILTHYDDFFMEPEEEMEFLTMAYMTDFLKEIQETAREANLPTVFWIPARGSQINFPLATRD
ncbi:MAG: MBL fold metallo-hydrolase [Planctomycetota bacterium]|nr:MBL fold metallo-hydrolase [Planctomycetota bacterium]